jgi:hypothetical protein
MPKQINTLTCLDYKSFQNFCSVFSSTHPEWKNLNKQLFGEWPLPEEELVHRKNK